MAVVLVFGVAPKVVSPEAVAAEFREEGRAQRVVEVLELRQVPERELCIDNLLVRTTTSCR